MDGLEVYAALRDKGVILPVIIMTGHGDVSLAVQAMKAGAVDFIEKPFEKAVLLPPSTMALRASATGGASQPGRRSRWSGSRPTTPREREVLEGLAKWPTQQDHRL